MSIDFLPIDPQHDRSNRWRAILALGSIIGGLVMAGAIYLIPRLMSLREVAVVLRSFSLAKDIPVEGGDVVVAPPELKSKLPELVGEMIASDSFTAAAMMVKDKETGAVLYRKNEYESWPLASLTKLMSALVILEKPIEWNREVSVVADEIMDTHMYAGDTYTLKELWLAALVGSSNKAILTLADAVGWPREAFVERMNEKARELGITDTVLVDSTGLSEYNISTASDIVLLLGEAMKSAEIREALTTKEQTLYSVERKKKHHLWNTNWLLLGWIPHEFAVFHGGKTGYIVASGYNFTMEVGDGAGHILEVVVLGAEGHEARFTEARDIAEWVFAHYQWPEMATSTF